MNKPELINELEKTWDKANKENARNFVRGEISYDEYMEQFHEINAKYKPQLDVLLPRNNPMKNK